MTDSRTDAESTAIQQSDEVTPPDSASAAEAAASTEAVAHAEASADTEPPAPEQDREKTMLEQMGGIPGLIYSTVPVLVFVLVNSLTSLQPAIWASLASAVAIAGWRLIRREPLQPAISGLLGVGVCVFIAHETGSAKGFFLFGIWVSLIYGAAFLVSALVRWPLAGVGGSLLNGTGFGWRSNRKALVGYDIATVSWTVVFLARFVVQHWLYNNNLTGWLAAARLGMGYPLTAVAALITLWAIRRERNLSKQAEHEAELAETGAEPVTD